MAFAREAAAFAMKQLLLSDRVSTTLFDDAVEKNQTTAIFPSLTC